MKISGLAMICVLTGILITSAGCAQKTEQKSTIPPLGMLDITSPGLSTSTSAESIIISGTTDAQKVFIKDNYFEVKDGIFSATVYLEPGDNQVPVSISNGIATTTIMVKVKKTGGDEIMESDGSEAFKVSAKVSSDTIKSSINKSSIKTNQITNAIDASKSTNDNAESLPVTFSSTELTLQATLGAAGVKLSWGRAQEPFQTYVIVKSQTDANLYFPKIFWIKAFNDIDSRYWEDRDLKTGRTYYRVCKITPEKNVVCGNVAHVTK